MSENKCQYLNCGKSKKMFPNLKMYRFSKEERKEIWIINSAPQTDPENKGIDENEVEEESNGKSDDNLDNQANNDEDKFSDKSDDKNQNELLNATEFKKLDTSKQRSRGRKKQWDTIILSSKHAEKIPIIEEKKKN
ncbi:hypothetical protein QTP88_022569 [Uroleucon formosanum]